MGWYDLYPQLHHNSKTVGVLCTESYRALFQDNASCRKEQRCAGFRLDRPGCFFTLTLCMETCVLRCYCEVSITGIFVESVCSFQQVWLEEDKDAHHDELVQASGGVFVPLVVESLGLWSVASCTVLQDIALRKTTRSDISRDLAYRHLLQKLSVCLWCHNALTFLHLFSL